MVLWGSPLLQVAGLLHQPALSCKKVTLLTLNRSPNLSLISRTGLPHPPHLTATGGLNALCWMNYGFGN